MRMWGQDFIVKQDLTFVRSLSRSLSGITSSRYSMLRAMSVEIDESLPDRGIAPVTRCKTVSLCTSPL